MTADTSTGGEPRCGSEYRCSKCDLTLENWHNDRLPSWCSRCAMRRSRRILDESPVEDGDIVEYDGDAYRADSAPQQAMFLIPIDEIGDGSNDPRTETPMVRDIRNLTPLNLRYEVRLADDRICDPADVDGEFNGFDCYNEAESAARAKCRAEDLAYRVWDTDQDRFVSPVNGDDVVTKDDPVVENPWGLDDEEKAEARRVHL